MCCVPRYSNGQDGRALQRAVSCEEWDVGVRAMTVGSDAKELAEVSQECESRMELEMFRMRLCRWCMSVCVRQRKNARTMSRGDD